MTLTKILSLGVAHALTTLTQGADGLKLQKVFFRGIKPYGLFSLAAKWGSKATYDVKGGAKRSHIQGENGEDIPVSTVPADPEQPKSKALEQVQPAAKLTKWFFELPREEALGNVRSDDITDFEKTVWRQMDYGMIYQINSAFSAYLDGGIKSTTYRNVLKYDFARMEQINLITNKVRSIRAYDVSVKNVNHVLPAAGAGNELQVRWQYGSEDDGSWTDYSLEHITKLNEAFDLMTKKKKYVQGDVFLSINNENYRVHFTSDDNLPMWQQNRKSLNWRSVRRVVVLTRSPSPVLGVNPEEPKTPTWYYELNLLNELRNLRPDDKVIEGAWWRPMTDASVNSKLTNMYQMNKKGIVGLNERHVYDLNAMKQISTATGHPRRIRRVGVLDENKFLKK